MSTPEAEESRRTSILGFLDKFMELLVFPVGQCANQIYTQY